MLYTRSNRYRGRVRRGRGLLSGAKTLGKRAIRLAKHAGRKMLGGFVDTAKKTAVATAKDQSGGLPAQILGSAAVGVTKAVESKLKETGALPTRDGDDVRQSDMTTTQQTMKRKLAEADASPSPKVIKTKTSKKKGRRRKVRRRGRGLSIFY